MEIRDFNLGPVLGASAALALQRSIFDPHEVSNLAYSGNPAGLIVRYVMAITRVGLPSGTTLLFGQEPRFVSYASDDFASRRHHRHWISRRPSRTIPPSISMASPAFRTSRP